MIVTALLTSVGINFGLCILFYTLYSILRKQPGNAHVYNARLVAEKKVKEGSHFQLDRLLPSAGWIKKAWQPSEEELLSIAGFDSVVFIRVFIFSLKIFSLAGAIGIFALLPINYLGGQLSDIDFADIPNQSLDLFSISNVQNGSKWLWVHFAAVYIISGATCYLLYMEHHYITSKRLAYFYSSKPEPHEFTIIVRGIPVAEGSTLDDSVEKFYREYHPSTYLSHEVVHRTSRLQSLIRDAEKLYKRIVQLNPKTSTEQNSESGSFFGRWWRKNLVTKYKRKLEDLEENVRIEQSDVSRGKEIPAAFVYFRSLYGAAIANHIQQSPDPTEWITEQAPEPRDVFWPFLSTTFLQKWISKLVVIVASIALTIVFLVPVVFVQGLANLDQLELWLPFLKSVLSMTVVSEVITGYLPSLILQMFLSIVPPIMKLFSSMQGYISYSQIERSACSKVLWFTIWNIFFANVLSGSVASQLNVFSDPKNIPMRLAVAVPAQASFFISYVVTSGWTSLSLELTRVVPLLCDFAKRHCCCCGTVDDVFVAPSIPYHRDIPKILFFGLLGITYFFLAPLIVPFLLCYYCLGYIIYRNQLLNVYMPKFETAGKFWPVVHNCLIFSLVLMQAIAVGIFALKKLALASSLTIPLPILTLIFNEYCRKRFLPIFNTYSAESLIKKDRKVQNDPSLDEFLDKLVSSYRDPALLPLQYSSTLDDGNRTPLLASEV
ncbi:CSC1-like protein HYP1 [Nymphaea colorata]|nr:CSC1-like protein HYP1 [Nymphaea colorata]